MANWMPWQFWNKRILFIFTIAVICFLIGGGWHFLNPHDDFLYGLYYRADSENEINYANGVVFLYCGPAAGLTGLLVSTGFVLIRKFIHPRHHQP